MTLAQFQVATNRTETNASLACFAICTPPCFAYTTSELRVSTNHFVCFVSFQPNHWYLHLQDKTWPPTLHAYCRRSDWSWIFGSRFCSIEINNQFMWSNLFKFNTCKALFTENHASTCCQGCFISHLVRVGGMGVYLVAVQLCHEWLQTWIRCTNRVHFDSVSPFQRFSWTSFVENVNVWCCLISCI